MTDAKIVISTGEMFDKQETDLVELVLDLAKRMSALEIAVEDIRSRLLEEK